MKIKTNTDITYMWNIKQISEYNNNNKKKKQTSAQMSSYQREGNEGGAR